MAYLPLSTANLPDPVIDPAQGSSPEDYFNTVLYTGNGSTQSITGVGFQPDFVAIKVRSVASGHYDFDVVRGTQKRIGFNTNGAEITNSNSLTSFDSDGFSVGSEDSVNGSGRTIVAWNWKAGTSFSNSAGANGASIASSGSANTDSGFSIVSYTGDSTGTDGTASTVYHGLSQAPEMIMFKPLDTYDGAVYHSGLTSASYRLVLFSASGNLAEASDNGFFNGTAPTSSVFSIGSRKHTNSNGGMIAYCFHSVDGFSKFGSYTGGSDPFVYLGFEPAMIIFKRATGTSTHWAIRDNVRKTDNPNRNSLYPSKADAEYTGTAHDIDFLSNGFKIRNGDGLFDASATYIYAAWAKAPFKYGTGV